MALELVSDTANGSYIQTENGNIVPQGRRNYLINGNFDSWQYAISQTTSGYGSDDRWFNQHLGSTKTHSQIACTDTERALFNASKFSRTVVTSVAGTSNYVLKDQRIEDVTKLAGKTVTISFWAKADSNKNIAFEYRQVFGTGGSLSAVVNGIGAQLVALTTTWQKKTITITLPSIVGKTLGTDGAHTSFTIARFWFDAGSTFAINSASLGQQSGTFDLAQVKIEDGAVATDGWHPYDGEFGGEVQACYRYYEGGGRQRAHPYLRPAGVNIGDANGFATCYFKARKRITPTIVAVGLYGVVNSISDIGVDNFTAYVTADNPTGESSVGSWTASAEI